MKKGDFKLTASLVNVFSTSNIFGGFQNCVFIDIEVGLISLTEVFAVISIATAQNEPEVSRQL